MALEVVFAKARVLGGEVSVAEPGEERRLYALVLRVLTHLTLAAIAGNSYHRTLLSGLGCTTEGSGP
jgi:hypothetical protein